MADELLDEDFHNDSRSDHTIGSSGDFSEAPPPPPGVSNTSREAVRGSERTPVISSPQNSEIPPRAPTNEIVSSPVLIADPTTNNSSGTFSSLSTLPDQSQITQPISDPSILITSALETALPQICGLPSVPDFNQESYVTARSSLSVESNFLEHNPAIPQEAVAGTSHPADPENKEDLVDRALLAEVLELGFEESIIILAISKTKETGGAEAVINWILEHSNESDFESDTEDSNAMGGAQSSAVALGRQHKMVLVVNTSLKMGVGKLAAQVGHAAINVYRLAQRSEEGQRALDAWRMIGEMKVVVKAQNTEVLLDLFKQAKDVGLFAYVVADAGRTQIPAGSRTVLGVFGSSELVDSVTGGLKLL